MIHQLRDRLVEIARHDLVVVAVDRSRHWRIRVAAPDGRETVLTVSSTANDVGCARKAFGAQLRRFARKKDASS
jgi:hypothetical protein